MTVVQSTPPEPARTIAGEALQTTLVDLLGVPESTQGGGA
jgi:hypothetical protein